ncbi:hypothetical protein HU200_049057 [Digitaria exilis]|uniref:F-box domain-containing protein n=1 Tax=Digitaria exilis TaxID=1010633 RepID=A0A835B550_9POAL|nr:hypothetical protein HU200_049057 [Digitaria exilis]
MAATGLSDLPNDLLRRILYLTPAREGASTAVLSRRWRWLWRTSGAVNLDSHSYRHLRRPEEALKKIHLFTRHMDAALSAAAGGEPVTKLTLHVEEPCYNMSLTYYANGSRTDMLTALLSNPAAMAVEEFSFTVAGGDPRRRRAYPNLAELRFRSLPSESLQKLHVTNCNTLIAPPLAAAAAARRRRRRLPTACRAPAAAVRRLATLHLESCYYSSPFNKWARGGAAMDDAPATACHRIVCPAVTTVVFEACSSSWPWKKGGLELESLSVAKVMKLKIDFDTSHVAAVANKDESYYKVSDIPGLNRPRQSHLQPSNRCAPPPMAATVLSDLPDDLLRRILSFTPAKEGASTAVLSRRWRSLWRTSGAINLDSRSYTHLRRPKDTRTKSHLFARHLEAALASSFSSVSVSGVGGGGGGWPVRKLTLYVEDPCYSMNLIYNLDGSRRDLLATLLSSTSTTPKAAVEELRFTIAGDPRHGGELRFESLPSESLTTLHVTNCNALIPPPPPDAVFRRLADLRLRWCGVSLADLRRMISAAPQLATLHLEPRYYYYYSTRNNLNAGGVEL